MISSPDYDFSFSGLKTAVLYSLPSKERNKGKSLPKINGRRLNDYCASFQQAAIDALIAKTIRAAKKHKVKTILLGGGVAANSLLRQELVLLCQSLKVNCQLSPVAYTGDNAAMIALAGYFRYKNGDFMQPNPQLKSWQKIKTEPSLRLV